MLSGGRQKGALRVHCLADSGARLGGAQVGSCRWGVLRVICAGLLRSQVAGCRRGSHRISIYTYARGEHAGMLWPWLCLLAVLQSDCLGRGEACPVHYLSFLLESLRVSILLCLRIFPVHVGLLGQDARHDLCCVARRLLQPGP